MSVPNKITGAIRRGKRVEVTSATRDSSNASSPDGGHPFAMEMLRLEDQQLRVGRQAGRDAGVPLVLFNGLGGNIELLAPIARWMPWREVITFDIPGVGRSPLPALPYRLTGIARLATRVLDHYGHAQTDVLGVSWGGAVAQQFARSHSERCRRLILCATATGMLMVPSNPLVALKLATPLRYTSKSYARRVAGEIYGGDYRGNPDLAVQTLKHVKWQSRLGYYLQLAAAAGWTSVHWLHRLQQPTLVMAGSDDPLVPLLNAKLMHTLIPRSELKVFDCGHLFLITRAEKAAQAINEFLDRP
jgi:poly(3-hydroxyalkanoate) depolymerase